MGPPGFWVELRKQGAYKQLKGNEVERLLDGCTVAVDASIWLYEAQTQLELVKVFGSAGACLKIFFERCSRFIRKGVLPVIVLEGRGGGRSERVHGGSQLGAAFAPHDKLRSLLCAMGVPYVDAEGEAEATCAALTQAGACEFAASSDFDALLFGAERVLKSVHLADRSVDSECELWEISHIDKVAGLDRDSLIAAAFLSGSDYDLRGTRASNGVRGVGVKKAMKTALELRRLSQGDTLSSVAAMVGGEQVDETTASQLVASNQRCRGCKCCGHGDVAKKVHGKRGCSLCGTSSGCLPNISNGGVCECSYCAGVRDAGGKERVAGARTLFRTASNASEDSSSSHGAHAVSSQYKRLVNVSLPDQGRFCWRKLESDKLKDALKGIFDEDAIDVKLQPLHFEFCLRRMALECPGPALSSLSRRRAWALKENLKYCPVSAKRINSSSCLFFAPYVLVSWIAALDDAETPLDLLPSARRARMALARKCCLLETDSIRSSVLLVVWKGLLAACPADTRKDHESLLAWGRTHELDLVPSTAVPRQSGKLEVWWNHCDTGRRETKAVIVVNSLEVEQFGLPIVARKCDSKKVRCQQVPTNQRRISDCFRQMTPRRSALDEQGPAVFQNAPQFLFSSPKTPPRRLSVNDCASPLRTPQIQSTSAETSQERLDPQDEHISSLHIDQSRAFTPMTPLRQRHVALEMTPMKRSAPEKSEGGSSLISQPSCKRRWRDGLLSNVCG